MRVAVHWLPWMAALTLAACSGPLPRPKEPVPPQDGSAAVPAKPSTKSTRKPQFILKKGGGFYKDDGPGDEIPDNLDQVPDAEPKWEPIHRPATKPYVVLGKEYIPNPTLRPYRATGIASWYGKKFHGQKTSIGEPYDMFAMTAAHTTLAIPSYVRVTNVQNSKSVIVRVTDRGPFHADRIIDLSYAAAWKLDLVNNGSGQVEVEAIIPDNFRSMAATAEDEIETLIKHLEQSETTATGTDTVGDNSTRVYLQLGAFSSADNAENLRNHLSRELDWLTEPMRINVSSGIHRLQLGPYPSRNDAAKVAERISLTLGFKPTVMSR